ncbi:MAG: 2-octaprenyl-6-methoxyphenyl hydroxylase [Betaproteobacteria bacterium]|nr:2-octaprenyl-6-methoxyphenyl hydroxylase [Betaproteobacteria bacterium]
MLPVAIVGGGPVGLSLALMLQHAGIDCAVLDARAEGALREDRRVLALSHGTRQILERLGAWSAIGATPISTIHVSQQGHLGRTLIEAREAGVPALGYVAEAGKVGDALAQACAAVGVTIRHETGVSATESGAAQARLHCITPLGHDDVAAQLIAWAEGAVSAERDVVRRDYGQQAVVASVQVRQSPAGLAYERFTPAGPVALLPLADRHALVWTVPEEEAAALLALDEPAFLSRLHDIFSGRLDFIAADRRAAFPLGLRYRQTPVGNRAVWLGNAAQTLHPVAGQGFNLALRDGMQLARLLQAHSGDCGDAALLARHTAARQLDRRSAISFTDGLVRIFGLRDDFSAHARGAGLLALDLLPAVRRFLARRMIFGARGW